VVEGRFRTLFASEDRVVERATRRGVTLGAEDIGVAMREAADVVDLKLDLGRSASASLAEPAVRPHREGR
jgi:hypothetical protein